MNHSKKMMAEAAMLYYQKKFTQQEIAERLHISRQTVSKLISDAVDEKIVEITVHDPEEDCRELERSLCEAYGLKQAVVCTTSGADEMIRQIQTVRAAAGFLSPLLAKGNRRIAISWGRTVERLINELDSMPAAGNTVFPLFGATDTDRLYFSPNELARNLADKLMCRVKNAWFPYLPDSEEDCALFQKTSYFRSMKQLWGQADIAILGVGDTTVLELFESTFGGRNDGKVVGDIATHFFSADGQFVPMYENRLCASVEDLKAAGLTVAVACGDNKADAIRGALRTGVVDVLITDEYTAKRI